MSDPPPDRHRGRDPDEEERERDQEQPRSESVARAVCHRYRYPSRHDQVLSFDPRGGVDAPDTIDARRNPGGAPQLGHLMLAEDLADIAIRFARSGHDLSAVGDHG